MRTEEIRSLNGNLTNDEIDMPYPHLYVTNPTDAVALVLTALPRGELSVLCEHKGLLKRIGSIEVSAINLLKLSKVCELSYFQTAENVQLLKTSIDIMEALNIWMQSSS